MEESIIFFVIGLLLGYLIKINHRGVPLENQNSARLDELERHVQYYKKLTKNLAAENQTIREQMQDQLT